MVNKNYLNYRGVYEFYILTTTCLNFRTLRNAAYVQSTGILVWNKSKEEWHVNKGDGCDYKA